MKQAIPVLGATLLTPALLGEANAVGIGGGAQATHDVAAMARLKESLLATPHRVKSAVAKQRIPAPTITSRAATNLNSTCGCNANNNTGTCAQNNNTGTCGVQPGGLLTRGKNTTETCAQNGLTPPPPQGYVAPRARGASPLLGNVAPGNLGLTKGNAPSPPQSESCPQ